MEPNPFANNFPTPSNMPAAEQNLPEQEPVIGATNRAVFWSVLLVAFLLLGGIATLVSKGALAMAAALPVPVTVQASSIKTTSFRLFPGVSGADNKSPVAVNQLDGTLTDLVITKTVTLPIAGNVTITLKAGQNNTPVNATGLTTDLSALSANNADFQGQSVSSNANGNDFEVDAKTATLTNVNISSPYLISNSMTLPGLTLTVS